MSLSHVSPEEWLQIGRAVFLVFSFILAAVSFAAWRGAALRQAEQSLAHGAEVLKRLEGLDTGLAAVTTLISQITETLERSSRADGVRAPTGYPIAIRLARSGASAPELVATCGISFSEADLVCRLHGAARALSSTAA